MNGPEQLPLDQVSVDSNNLYKEETYTDMKVASIRRLSPVKTDGSPDESRPILFVGQTSIMSQMGPLPIQCPIDAQSFEEAVEKFPQAVREAIERMVEEANELRRQESSRIVVPSGGVPPGGLTGSGGPPRGGGIISG